MPNPWTHPALTETLHTRFRFEHPQHGVVECELIEVSALKQTPRQQSYSILFRGPLASPLGQGAYPTRHEQLETIELFIVPVGQDSDGLRYQAVFNRLVEPVPSPAS